MELDHYRENLRHVVRPDEPSQRRESSSIKLRDYEGLYLAEHLREYAEYEETDEELDAIARSIIEYVEMCVRDEDRTVFDLYLHTSEARTVVKRGIWDVMDHTSIAETILEMVEGLEDGKP